MFMNIAGSIFAITAIVLCAIDLAHSSLLWMCDDNRNNADHYDDSCRNVALLVQVRELLMATCNTLIHTTTLSKYEITPSNGHFISKLEKHSECANLRQAGQCLMLKSVLDR